MINKKQIWVSGLGAIILLGGLAVLAERAPAQSATALQTNTDYGTPIVKDDNQASVMTATDKYVYVMRGDELYQFNASGLTLIKKVNVMSATATKSPVLRAK